jgi:hypothetical protein
MCVSVRVHAVANLSDRERQSLKQALIEKIDCIQRLRSDSKRADLAGDYNVKIVNLLRPRRCIICRIHC